MEKYTRLCPSCNKILEYTTKYNKNAAAKRNKLCMSCASVEKTKKYGSYITKLNEQVSKGERQNGFQGKKHTQASKNSMSNARKEQSYKYKTDEYRKKMSSVTAGEKNPMYRKTVYEAWVKRYGEEEAIIRQKLWKASISKATKGEKNPMFDKPSPKGSGNGWSGHYNGWYFRSIHELSYMIKVIERFNLNWKNAESSKYKINYIGYDGSNRTYVADFLINDKYLIEIKPNKLKKSPAVVKKSEAAKLWSKDRGLVYKITNCSKLSYSEIKDLVDKEKVVFLDKYKIKYEKQSNKPVDPS